MVTAWSIASSLAFATASAQSVSYKSGNYAISVNVPSDTATSGNGPIYMQLSAPSGTQWVGFGQGTQMAGANMIIMYAQDSTNVTISPRLGRGEVMPQFNSNAQITVLGGTGVHSDGSMVANIRCDSCLSWNGGSVAPTSSDSSWIWAYKNGNSLNSNDVSATITQHDVHGNFKLDLTQGTGGSSANPFVQSNSPQASGTSPSNPLATSGPDSDSGSTTADDSNGQLQLAHGVIMSLLFLGIFPLSALTLYLPYAQRVRLIHGPLQVFGTILLIIGMALGITLGRKIHELDRYHMIIGFIVVSCMVLFQPAMGIYQHLHYRKTGGRSVLGIGHRWFGRLLMVLGVINGGFGYHISGTTDAYAAYGVIAGIVFLMYLGTVVFFSLRKRQSTSRSTEEKLSTRATDYEMQIPQQSRHNRIPSEASAQIAHQNEA